MKLSTKPISSPSRTDKFPPPLMMRFLRTNIGNKSHRKKTPTRSLSSPMFLRKNKLSSNIETTQEPSSPKVTCMGQVRVRKKKNSKASKSTNPESESLDSCRCRWIPSKVLNFRGLVPKVSIFPVVGKLSSVFSRRKKTSQAENEKTESNDSSRNISEESYRPIPTNALILTRCRSAPYRSSSLARRFWESPMNGESEEKEEREEKVEEFEAPVKEEEVEEKREEVEIGFGLSILTRCKSEPARIGEKLYSEEISFSRGRRRRRSITRLGFVDYL